MKKIGLVGEDPHDTFSIKNLLSKEKKYNHLSFIILAKQIRGYQLDNPKTKRTIDFEVKEKKPDLIIFIRDLDAHEQNHVQVDKRKKWFQELNNKGTGILLLNIYELEALILSDINTFNKIFRTKISFASDPMKQKDPKEFLIEKTRKNFRTYSERDSPEIFSELNVETLKIKCRYFENFIIEFEERIFPKKRA